MPPVVEIDEAANGIPSPCTPAAIVKQEEEGDVADVVEDEVAEAVGHDLDVEVEGEEADAVCRIVAKLEAAKDDDDDEDHDDLQVLYTEIDVVAIATEVKDEDMAEGESTASTDPYMAAPVDVQPRKRQRP